MLSVINALITLTGAVPSLPIWRLLKVQKVTCTIPCLPLPYYLQSVSLSLNINTTTPCAILW